jgi:Sporulation and spore germination
MRQRHFWAVAMIFTTLAALLAACGSITTVSSVNGTPNSTATTITTPGSTPIVTSTSSGQSILVYFSKHPDSDNDFKKVFGVHRTTTSTTVGTYAIEQLIAGPLPSEDTNLFSQTKSILNLATVAHGTASDHCSVGDTFVLSINSGTARLQFCVVTSSGGIGDDARAISEITSTLKQFSTISQVKICTSNSQTFGDESGLSHPC